MAQPRLAHREIDQSHASADRFQIGGRPSGLFVARRTKARADRREGLLPEPRGENFPPRPAGRVHYHIVIDTRHRRYRFLIGSASVITRAAVAKPRQWLGSRFQSGNAGPPWSRRIRRVGVRGNADRTVSSAGIRNIVRPRFPSRWDTISSETLIFPRGGVSGLHERPACTVDRTLYAFTFERKSLDSLSRESPIDSSLRSESVPRSSRLRSQSQRRVQQLRWNLNGVRGGDGRAGERDVPIGQLGLSLKMGRDSIARGGESADTGSRLEGEARRRNAPISLSRERDARPGSAEAEFGGDRQLESAPGSRERLETRVSRLPRYLRRRCPTSYLLPRMCPVRSLAEPRRHCRASAARFVGKSSPIREIHSEFLLTPIPPSTIREFLHISAADRESATFDSVHRFPVLPFARNCDRCHGLFRSFDIERSVGKS